MLQLNVKKNIAEAETLTTDFYKNSSIFEQAKEKVFASTWQYIADATVLDENGTVYPFTLLPDILDEPLVLTKDKDGKVRCLSNVCTHRGKIIIEKPGKQRLLSCGYHGRCFHLDGRFKSMPEFKHAINFPTKADDLAEIPLKKWLGMYFINLNNSVDFDEMVQPIMDRIGWMPLDTLEFSETGTQNFPVNAHWALYCDNYLEGFHVPFVHPALNEALDFQNYDYEIFPYCNLQIGIADDGEPHFDIPQGAPDYGKKVYAYYFWLFPNIMLNFYPWGLSFNYIRPISQNKTMVHFRTYHFKDIPFDRSVNNLERTEYEDEAIVESVQQGVHSRYYTKGRFSPSQERAVHHFHSLIAEFMH